jgi:hypothetical protein
MTTLPAGFRHLILAVLTVLLTWGGTELVPFLRGQTGYGALLAAVLAALIAYFTPLVNSYGVGASRINYGVSTKHSTDL